MTLAPLHARAGSPGKGEWEYVLATLDSQWVAK